MGERVAGTRARDERQQALEMTQRLNDYYSEWIREHPSDWLCVKRRKPKAGKARLRHLRAPG